jgi:hypothetical protein
MRGRYLFGTQATEAAQKLIKCSLNGLHEGRDVNRTFAALRFVTGQNNPVTNPKSDQFDQY